MGIRFDENASNYIQITDAAALTLPNSDWCICFWESTSDNSGTFFQYVISGGNFGAANSINVYFQEAGNTFNSNQDKLTVYIVNGSTNSLFGASTIVSSTLTFNGSPRLWVIQRSSGNGQIYSCDQNGSVTTHHNSALNATGSVDPPELELGRRADGNADRTYGGDLGHVFKGDFSLTTSQISALGKGRMIHEIGKSPSYYLPLLQNVASPPDLSGGLTVARNGTLADGIAFPPDIRGFMNAMVFTLAAGGVSVNVNGSTVNWNGLTSYNWNGVA